MSEKFNAKAFTVERDNVLIAPAGFGKTHTISECLKHTEGRQLILTHTQAGVASIRDKLQKSLVGKEKYYVETISSFAKRYVLSFTNLLEIPDETDGKKFYAFFIENAIKIISLKLVQDVIKLSYAGLFVDEYQDCSIEQHKLILVLADILPTHILGDPLQGIFGFNGQLVDLNSTIDMSRFTSRYELVTPHRWINNGNTKLGEEIYKIRQNLEQKKEIDLVQYPSIEFKQGLYGDHYSAVMDALKTSDSVLVVDSDSINMTNRENFVVAFRYIPFLIEAFDGKDFYTSAILFDNKDNLSAIDVLHKFIVGKFSNLDNWYDKVNKRFKNKRDPIEESQLNEIKALISKLSVDYSILNLRDVILKIRELKGVNCARIDLLSSLSNSMGDAHNSKITVLEAMRRHRNGIRSVGRKMYGRCVGTTLLTKGLEFDTVIVLDADKFKDPQNFYVAISRCVKRLMIFADKSKINPYS